MSREQEYKIFNIKTISLLDIATFTSLIIDLFRPLYLKQSALTDTWSNSSDIDQGVWNYKKKQFIFSITRYLGRINYACHITLIVLDHKEDNSSKLQAVPKENWVFKLTVFFPTTTRLGVNFGISLTVGRGEVDVVVAAVVVDRKCLTASTGPELLNRLCELDIELLLGKSRWVKPSYVGSGGVRITGLGLSPGFGLFRTKVEGDSRSLDLLFPLISRIVSPLSSRSFTCIELLTFLWSWNINSLYSCICNKLSSLACCWNWCKRLCLHNQEIERNPTETLVFIIMLSCFEFSICYSQYQPFINMTFASAVNVIINIVFILNYFLIFLLTRLLLLLLLP